MSCPCLRPDPIRILIPICGVLAFIVSLTLSAQASAQTVLPPTSGVIAPTPPPIPVRPLPYSPFGYYDLLAGFRPTYLGAAQPLGHQIVATSRNGYIYQPVYDPPAVAPSPGSSMPMAVAAPGAPVPPVAAPPALTPELQSAVQDFQAGRYDMALTRLQQLVAADANNGFAWLLISHSQFALERFADSATSLRRALGVLPENAWGQILDRYGDYYRATRYTTHLRALETFAAAHPAEPATHLLLGYHYGFLGYRPQAVGQLQRATADKVDRLLLAHFGGQPASSPMMAPGIAVPLGASRVDAPPPAPETLEPPTGAGLPRAF